MQNAINHSDHFKITFLISDPYMVESDWLFMVLCLVIGFFTVLFIRIEDILKFAYM